MNKAIGILTRVGTGYPGSLTLGGFDQARISNGSTSTFIIDSPNSALSVVIASILVDFNDRPVMEFPLPLANAVIDSTLPFFYFPNELAQWLADTLNLTYDGDPAEGYSGLYVLDKEQQDRNNNLIRQIIFNLEDDTTLVNTSITIPYEALIMNASWAWRFPEIQPIFPMRNVTNKTIVLGRAFLQTSYLSVLYDDDGTTKMNLSRAAWPEDMTPQLMPIYNSTTLSNSGLNSGLSKGEEAGIAVGSIFVAGVLGFLLWHFIARKRLLRKRETGAVDDQPLKPELDAQEPEIHKTKLMSEATGDTEIHMLDGNERQAELQTTPQELEGSAPAPNAITDMSPSRDTPIVPEV
jgi:hypothetical protein